ncbi:hypothetical protein D3C81_1824450 [compost metagenome]
MQNDPRDGEQRAVVAQQHQPAPIAGLRGHRIAAVIGQGRVIGVGAFGKHVDLAVQRQAFGDLLKRSTEVNAVGVEQAIGVDAANVEGHAGGEGVFQLFAAKVRKQVLTLHQRVFGEVVEVAGDLVIHDPHEDPAPGHEQRTVERQQSAAGGAPAVRRVRQ